MKRSASEPGLRLIKSGVYLLSVPATFRDQANPNFTIKRMYDTAREEFEQLERLREVCSVLISCISICSYIAGF